MSESRPEIAWVIERGVSDPAAPEYFTGILGKQMWSAPGDDSEACRFSREIDARRLVGSLESHFEHRVAEHMWG